MRVSGGGIPPSTALAGLGPELVFALTENHLPTADRTPLNITTKDMKLPLDGSAVVARLPVSSPILRLLTVANTLALDAADYNRWL